MVSTMIGTLGIIRFNARAASIPLITGIFKSRMIRLGLYCLASAIACAPSTASTQRSKSFSPSKILQRALRKVGLSSATKIALAIRFLRYFMRAASYEYTPAVQLSRPLYQLPHQQQFLWG